MPVLKHHGLEACTGCAICVLPCPVWRDSHDPWLTPHGRARAIQAGADVLEVADSLLACTMCGACDPVCPEQINVSGAVRQLRLELTQRGANPLSQKAEVHTPTAADSQVLGSRVLIGGRELKKDTELMQRIRHALGDIDFTDDNGQDLAWAAEVGAVIDESRAESYVARLSPAKEIIVVDGMLAVWLREQQPKLRVRGLAEVLLRDAQLVAALRSTDLLILDARSFHSDYHKMLSLAHRVRNVSGCRLNLDLQRVAIPAAEIEWILEGLDPERIVVENPEDVSKLLAQCDQEVIHLVDIGG